MDDENDQVAGLVFMTLVSMASICVGIGLLFGAAYGCLAFGFGLAPVVVVGWRDMV